MSVQAALPEPATRPRARTEAVGLAAIPADVWMALAVGGVLAAIAFLATGGLDLGRTTPVEMALTLGGSLAVAVAILMGRWRDARPGAVSLVAFAALAALTALSVGWSVQPDASWVEAGRTTSYVFAFALAMSLVRMLPGRWAGVLGGIVLGAVIVCGYAVLTKIAPSAFSSSETYSRLPDPYGYWNALGLTAAMAVPACVWLGARRSGRAGLNALAYPALALLIVTLFLSYSRGSLLAAGIGLLIYFTAVPLRLRSFLVLAIGALGAAVVVVWDFGQGALAHDHVALEARVTSGRQLGILLGSMLVVLLVVGLLVGFEQARRPISAGLRRRIGTAIVIALALVPVAGAIGLAGSSRGFGGSISHAFSQLTNPDAKVPNDPSRLTAVGSVRARYWNDGLKIFRAHPVIGVGAGGYQTARLRVRSDVLDVAHAHGYVIQTLADLGIVGVVVSVALLGAWLVAATRATRPWQRAFDQRLRLRRAPAPYTEERVALLVMLAIVMVFGMHSLIDWTWLIPGDTCVALLCAGWLAARGWPATLGAAVGSRSAHSSQAEAGPGAEAMRRVLAFVRTHPLRTSASLIVLSVAALAAWGQWLPLGSSNAENNGLAAADSGNLVQAQADFRDAISLDPLAAQPWIDLATVEQAAGRLRAAQSSFERAVEVQPDSPYTWQRLADFEHGRDNNGAALRYIRVAAYLNPMDFGTQEDFVTITRAVAAG